MTEDYFPVLGVRPAMGRAFAQDEYAAPGAAPVAVLSHTFWQTRFGGAADILDRTLRLNGTTYSIVGVAPEGFGGMFPAVTAQMWIPTAMVEDVALVGLRRALVEHEISPFRAFRRASVHVLDEKPADATASDVRNVRRRLARDLARKLPATEKLVVLPS